jgi:phage-related protein
MLGGFRFKGIHSSAYGVRETPSNKVLSPLKRRSLITIPGRSNAFIEEDGGYEPRVESILCSYALPLGANIHYEVRKIAGWLDGVGELTFDYEPDLHYNAYLSSAPPNVTMLEFAQFELEFTMVHPFAYETATQLNNLLGVSNREILITTDGTVETPVRLVIKNLTGRAIRSLTVYHEYLES